MTDTIDGRDGGTPPAARSATAEPAADPDGATASLLRETAERAIAYRRSLPERRVGPAADLTADALRSALGGPLPDGPQPPDQVIERLVAAVEPGLVASGGPRYFGFVVGGSLPAPLAADWLTSTWDQNAGLYVLSPAAAVAEEVAGAWLLDLFGLPADASVGFTNGATLGNLTAIVAARDALLRGAGWDVEADGLYRAPEIDVIVGQQVHASVLIALRLAGFGAARPRRVPADDQGRMEPAVLRSTLRELGGRDRPTLVSAQVGEVNSGAWDDVAAIEAIVRDEREAAWLHVDGAFGLWVRTVPSLRGPLDGLERADSWVTDTHKWLNVPYDSGLVFVRNGAAHRASTSISAAYLTPAPGLERDPFEWVPEMSRRARGFAIWAALASLGRGGVAELVERACAVARRMAERLAAEPGVEVLNDVVLNQVLVRFGDDDERTRAVIRRVQDDGTAWLGGTTWRGRAAMRISVSSWWTGEADADASVDAILRAHRAAGAHG